MENRKKPSSAASRRRLDSLDVKKSSSSLSISTSSLRSIGEARKESSVHASRRSSTTTVRFAPPPPSSSSTRSGSRLVSQQQAMARPATARPASSSGPKVRPPAAGAGSLPRGSSETGQKAMRRSWGWTAAADAKESEIGEPTAPARKDAKIQVRSSSVPRRLPTDEEKPLPLKTRDTKTKMTASRRSASPDSTPKPDVNSTHKASMQRNPSIAIARKTIEKSASNASLSSSATVANAKASPPPPPPPPPPSRTTATTIGASSWVSLPPGLQSLGLDVMSYRDAAEVAAVEALQEASAAEVLLRCLSAFAGLASAAAEQPPQQTVDEFLALHGALARSAAVLGDHHHHQARRGRAEDWLGAAVGTDLARFQLYSAPSPRKPGTAAASPAASPPPPAARRPVTTEEETITWLEAAARELGEDACAWFLGYVERLVDGDVAGTLGQLKRVNDWLDQDAAGPRSEGVERLRKKIFGYLLDHVESAVVALNGGVGPAKRK